MPNIFTLEMNKPAIIKRNLTKTINKMKLYAPVLNQMTNLSNGYKIRIQNVIFPYFFNYDYVFSHGNQRLKYLLSMI